MITKPIHDYVPVFTPMEHQQKVWLESRDRPYYALWWEMGTGKSKTIIDTFCWLYLTGQIDGVIIVSDKGCYQNWEGETDKQMPESINYRICTWSSTMNRQDQQWCESLMTAKDDTLDILLMNVEAFSGERALQVAEKFRDSHYTLLAVDESTSIKSMKASRTKSLIKLASKCDYRRVLTGTPITQDPLDLYSQCELLSPQCLGHRSFTGFRSEYAVMRRMTLSGGRSFDTVVGFRNLDKLEQRLFKFSSRVLKSECLDLPDKVYETIQVEHTSEQAEAYNKLKNEAILMLNQGMLTTTSALTVLNKLHQINCGHVKIDDGTEVMLPNNRVSDLIELLEKIPSKVIIWCAFQIDVVSIKYAIYEKFGGNKYAVTYYGPNTPDERQSALGSFRNDPNCQWFIGTAATGGKGIDGLQDACNYMVYFSNTDSLEDRLQSEDRLHRKGQKNQVTIIDMVIPKTVDVKVLARLKEKKDLASEVLDKLPDLI